MPERQQKQTPSDVRLLILKKWNLPHTASICEVGGEYGEYVSYQNYHFIDIQPIEGVQDSGYFRSVYNKLEENRKIQVKMAFPIDVHTIQSMTLVGDSTDFWNTHPNVVYISLIQLTNGKIDNLPFLKEQILSAVRTAEDLNAPVHCALYESLDFCDLVLFTTGIKLESLQKKLWSLTLMRDHSGFQNIRDTFSFCCFRCQFLKQVFQDGTETVDWDDTLSLSVDLSVQCLEQWNILRKELNEIQPCDISKMLGRYDIRLTYSDVPSKTVLQILSKLDKHCSSEDKDEKKGLDRSFVSYQITLFSNSQEQEGSMPGKRALVNTQLYENVLTAMSDWHRSQDSAAFDFSRIYIEETFSALLTLSKSGFADEFVISVLPSLQSYIMLMDELAKLWDDQSFKQEAVYAPQIFFRALNTLVLCTMHNERQFVQSPAFNATYFDVPPKLLAFFSALSGDIVQALSQDGDEKNTYQFLLIPDYRNDIVVNQLVIDPTNDRLIDPKNHLAVVSLHESLFYDPIKAVAVLCHEIAHYVGNRQREKRAEYIFQAVGVLLLKNTSYCANQKVDTFCGSLLEVLAQGFADCLKGLIDGNGCGASRGIPYLLQGISDFLRQVDYGFSLFESSDFSWQLGNVWRTLLQEKLNAHDTKVQSDFTTAVGKIDNTLKTRMLTEENCNKEYAIDVFVRSLLYDLCHIRDEWEVRDSFTGNNTLEVYARSCENIIQAFSETYADYRMLDILKEHVSAELYRTILELNHSEDDTQMVMRYRSINSVGMFCKPDLFAKQTYVYGEDGAEVYEIIEELLVRYLKGLPCNDEDSASENELRTIYKTFLERDALAQVSMIRDKITRFRNA